MLVLIACYLAQQTVSPMGSRENLGSPQSPQEIGQPHSGDWQQSGSRKNSLMTDSTTINRRTSMQEVADRGPEHKQTTSEMFKDLLSQKRNMILSKLTSFDSDVSRRFFHSITHISMIGF